MGAGGSVGSTESQPREHAGVRGALQVAWWVVYVCKYAVCGTHGHALACDAQFENDILNRGLEVDIAREQPSDVNPPNTPNRPAGVGRDVAPRAVLYTRITNTI